jgi:ubiquinone/menaquinone biosynthesis C-methylase UbiE
MKTVSTGGSNGLASQCQKPRGWLGRILLWNMNSRHSHVTDWGLKHVGIEPHYTILDVGCGGGRTVSKLAKVVKQGKVYGIDYSEASVAMSKKTNARWIDMQRVEIRHASVSQLPFEHGSFDLVTAVETHFWWPDLPAGVREIYRILKPGGTLVVIAEVYKGANTAVASLLEKKAIRIGMKLLDVGEHRALLESTGYSEVRISEEHNKGWICAMGTKPITNMPDCTKPV